MSIAPEGDVNPEFDFADRLRKIRRSVAGLTQAEMADELGVSQKAYSAWEAGRNTPTNLVAIAKRAEMRWRGRVTAAWILGVDEKNPRPDGGPDGGSVVRPKGFEPLTS
ncbi:hypothetical protein CH296_11030 [Rhodococcus sp. 14-2496-1d]|uniref:helix-turn-helix domain-containing protein n=1 Tax=Rhodococcus sp. 14-2496-1d TaxID=2023146 RepID=UPI000B9AA2F3|nr:hypothetical protein CH296_11030 [Rhodococcus sp. 14-2496-1d]